MGIVATSGRRTTTLLPSSSRGAATKERSPGSAAAADESGAAPSAARPAPPRLGRADRRSCILAFTSRPEQCIEGDAEPAYAPMTHRFVNLLGFLLLAPLIARAQVKVTV